MTEMQPMDEDQMHVDSVTTVASACFKKSLG